MRIYKDFDLKNYSTMKVPSRCENFFQVQSKKDVIEFCESDFLILGKGSNTLLNVEHKNVLYFGKEFSKVEFFDNKVKCQSGKSVVSLCKMLAQKGLTGLEFASGIPASVGGALKMNAGAFNSDFSQVTECVNTFDRKSKTTKKFSAKECGFGYRKSIFSNDLIILDVTFVLKESSKEEVFAKMKNYLQIRSQNQPIDRFSLGSIFLSDKHKVAKIIDDLGLRGAKIGGAEVSTKHCGFIVNNGNATTKDILALIEFIKQKVLEKHNINLTEEIIIGK